MALATTTEPISADATTVIRLARLPGSTDVNPYQARLYDGLAHEGIRFTGDGSLRWRWLVRHRREVDVLHIHWRLDRLADFSADPIDLSERPIAVGRPRAAWRACRVATQLTVARGLGYRVAWTVHEPALFEVRDDPYHQILGRVLAAQADVILVHDHQAAAWVEDRLRPRAEVTVTAVGHHTSADSTAAERARCRAGLGIDAHQTMILSFGNLREDKQPELLIDAFSRTTDPDAVLVLGGMVEPHIARRLRRAAELDDRIHLLDGFIPASDLDVLIACADVVALGRSVLWTPSSLVHALSIGTPVIAADLASNHEHLGPGAWWFAPHDVISLTSTIEQVLAASPEERVAVAEAGQRHVWSRGWPEAAASTALALRAIAPRPRRPRRPAVAASEG